MKFQPGQSGNPLGMRKGTERKIPAEAQAMARRIFDASYWKLKAERIRNGTEHPKIEELLLTYAYGSPPREPHTGPVIQLGVQTLVKAAGGDAPLDAGTLRALLLATDSTKKPS